MQDAARAIGFRAEQPAGSPSKHPHTTSPQRVRPVGRALWRDAPDSAEVYKVIVLDKPGSLPFSSLY